MWYAKDIERVKTNTIYKKKEIGDDVAAEYKWIMLPNRKIREMTQEEYTGITQLPIGGRAFRYGPLTSQGWSETGSKPFVYNEKEYSPGQNQHWKSIEAMKKLVISELLIARTNTLSYYMFLDNFPVFQSVIIGLIRNGF